MDKISHQNKTTLFWRKKAKINLHQNFPIYGIVHDAHQGHNTPNPLFWIKYQQ
jgi:hypothetical protein